MTTSHEDSTAINAPGALSWTDDDDGGGGAGGVPPQSRIETNCHFGQLNSDSQREL